MTREGTSPSFDSHLDALGHVDRRRLLLALLDARADGDLPVEVSQVAHGAAETDGGLSMHHVHLPKLDDYGFVDADADGDAVTTGPRFDEIRPLLELLDANREQLADDWLHQPRLRQ
ncbi:hypothetical protein [Halobacterium yunchengense]|uniref:hypothetical protein n=1 Tax=Halobacterium yunchengense TaxID=3108497 RepID=UPI00300894B2